MPFIADDVAGATLYELTVRFLVRGSVTSLASFYSAHGCLLVFLAFEFKIALVQGAFMRDEFGCIVLLAQNRRVSERESVVVR